jgi:hypothetical protein
MEPALRPLGFDWKIGVGCVSAFAAREVFVSTIAIVYGAGDTEGNTADLSNAMRADHYPDGRPVWTPLVATSLLVWFVLAMQCLPTLAVTRLVDDERPLWVGMNGNGRVRSIGRSAGDAVTAGFYLFSDRARRLAGPPRELPRLRDFLAWLLAEGEPIHAIDVGEVVDVDRASDVEAAERLAAKFARSSVRPTGEPSSEAGR